MVSFVVKSRIMWKKFIVAGLVSVVMTACVPQRKFQELEAAYNSLNEKNKNCEESLKNAKEETKQAEKENIQLEKRVSKLVADSIETHTLFETNRKLYGELKDSYEKLLKNNKLAEEKLYTSLKELEEKLKLKEQELALKEANLNQNIASNKALKLSLDSIRIDLEKKQSRIIELQSILAAKDSAVNGLKDKLTKSLLGFKDKGINVEVKGGKVYVSLDEKLLFASASIVVDKKGEEALLELAKTIRDMEDIHIMVEGHTDDVPIKTSQIKDNWDLSVLRATSIVRILTEKGKVNPKQLIAAGRGEFHPVDPGKTKEARAKNRRTEIIISPNLDEVFELLDKQ